MFPTLVSSSQPLGLGVRKRHYFKLTLSQPAPYFPDCETEQDTNSRGALPTAHPHFNESAVSMLLRVTFKISAWTPEAHQPALFMAKL